MRSVTVFVLGLVLLSPLGGCETMKGMGRDIEKAGEAIQKGAS